MSTDIKKSRSPGLLIVYTGDGKGKTTAALGMCVRAAGYGWPICVVQFVKGSWKYGEMKGITHLTPPVDLVIVGEGFVGIIDDTKDIEEHKKAARKGIELLIGKIKSGDYRLVIADELSVALQLNLIDRNDVEAVLAACGSSQHLVITGRDAPEWLIERADLVTEMKEIKHPFRQGMKAQKGIDW